jgi:hypothetical protein
MTRFEKQVVGVAEAILSIDCGAIHGGNWRLPCRRCIDQEKALSEQLQKLISDEGCRRRIRGGCDKRDGNKPSKKQGSYAG